MIYRYLPLIECHLLLLAALKCCTLLLIAVNCCHLLLTMSMTGSPKGYLACVRADKLTREDMATNKPDPTLAVHAHKSHLGHVDGFMSHSWHDDPESKWLMLQEWREEFKKANGGREPTLWIDKYCIDQNNIECSLECLPVYLAGCKQLLILCGETYLQRLWCVVEIFVFLEMGGELANLDVRLLQSGNRAIEGFDVTAARCFTQEDTVRLHDVIRSTGYSKITKLVQSVFATLL